MADYNLYQPVEWTDTPETPTNAYNLNHMDEGVRMACNGDNTPKFTNSDSVEDTEENPLNYIEVEPLEEGEQTGSIITKASKMFRNVRFLKKNISDIEKNISDIEESVSSAESLAIKTYVNTYTTTNINGNTDIGILLPVPDEYNEILAILPISCAPKSTWSTIAVFSGASFTRKILNVRTVGTDAQSYIMTYVVLYR